MLRVLHVGKYFPPHRGGMETFLADLMAAQARQGLAPAALVHSSRPALADVEDSVEFGDARLPITRAAVWFTLFFAPIAPGFWRSLQRSLRRHQPRVLHLHMPNTSVFWLLCMPSARRLPWVVHWHADVLASRHSLALRLLYPLYRPFEQAVLRRAAAIIVTSPPYLHSSEALRSHRERCRVIPLGLDERRLQAPTAESATEPQEAAGEEKPAALLAVGRLTYYKGYHTLIDALALVPDVTLQIIGSGEQEQALRARVRRLGLENRVDLRGARSDADVVQALRSADLLCQPSLERTEAFGIVLLEAMALGKPLLAGDVPGSGMPWVVGRSGAGSVVPPGNAPALAAAIRSLCSDRAKLRALGEAGRTCFQTEFRIDVAAGRVTELYRSLPADISDP